MLLGHGDKNPIHVLPKNPSLAMKSPGYREEIQVLDNVKNEEKCCQSPFLINTSRFFENISRPELAMVHGQRVLSSHPR